MSPAIFHLDFMKDIPHLSRWEFSKFLAAKTLVTVGSDWTVTPTPNVLPAVASIVEKIGAFFRESDESHDGLTDVQRGSRMAIRLLTLNGAEAVGSQYKVGSIEAGKWANFIAVDRDLTEGYFADAKVIQTWFEGRIVYTAR